MGVDTQHMQTISSHQITISFIAKRYSVSRIVSLFIWSTRRRWTLLRPRRAHKAARYNALQPGTARDRFRKFYNFQVLRPRTCVCLGNRYRDWERGGTPSTHASTPSGSPLSLGSSADGSEPGRDTRRRAVPYPPRADVRCWQCWTIHSRCEGELHTVLPSTNYFPLR